MATETTMSGRSAPSAAALKMFAGTTSLDTAQMMAAKLSDVMHRSTSFTCARSIDTETPRKGDATAKAKHSGHQHHDRTSANARPLSFLILRASRFPAAIPTIRLETIRGIMLREWH